MSRLKQPFRLAVIGAGGVGSIHIKNALNARNIQLVGVCELDNEKSKSSLNGAAVPIVSQLENLVKYEPEGVIIASTTSSHGKIAQEAIELSLPFLCEKPLALDLTIARDIAQQAAKKNVYGAMAFNRRFHERYSQMRKAIKNGEIGSVETFHVVSRSANQPSAKFIVTSGGLFGEKGSHFYDLLRWILNTEVEEVFVFGGALFDVDFKTAGQPDTAIVSMRLKNGILCHFDFSWRSAYGQDERIEIAGSKRMIQGTQTTTAEYQRFGENGYSMGGKLPSWQTLFEKTYRDEVQTFIKDIKSSKYKVMPTLSDGVKAQEIAQAINLSYERKRPVSMSELGI